MRTMWQNVAEVPAQNGYLRHTGLLPALDFWANTMGPSERAVGEISELGAVLDLRTECVSTVNARSPCVAPTRCD